MISVIIPVYNVEPYLRKCLDSVVNQTYKDLEILIIDDGSTDGSGAVCDEYADADERIRVFHTENRGLSCARNLGLDEAKGEWIGFVDSDDWIEPDMYEVLIDRALETGADVVECGVYREYPDKAIENRKKSFMFADVGAVHALLRGENFNTVWNKLWRYKSLEAIRFPEGIVYEDIATTYKVLYYSECVCTIPVSKYHHSQRQGSISKTSSLKSFADNWVSNKERYEFLKEIIDDEEKRKILEWCALAAVRTQVLYFDSNLDERKPYIETIKTIDDFIRRYLPWFGYQGWGLRLRAGVALVHFKHLISFPTILLMNYICKRLTVIEA